MHYIGMTGTSVVCDATWLLIDLMCDSWCYSKETHLNSLLRTEAVDIFSKIKNGHINCLLRTEAFGTFPNSKTRKYQNISQGTPLIGSYIFLMALRPSASWRSTVPFRRPHFHVPENFLAFVHEGALQLQALLQFILILTRAIISRSFI